MLDGGIAIEHLHELSSLPISGHENLFQASDTRLERTVAVRLEPPFVDPEVEASWAQRVHAFARASSHPHVVTVYDAGKSGDGQPYLVFEQVDGTLSDMLASSTAATWEQACDMTLGLGAALQETHAAGLVHLDLRPQNIFVTGGVPKFGDVGLVWPWLSNGSVEALSYRAPESLANGFDVQTDIYSLTAILHHLIDGQPPHWRPNDTPQALAHRITTERPPMLDPSMAPPDLVRFVTAGLSPERLDRPQNAAEFLRELSLVRQGRTTGSIETVPVSAAPPPSASPMGYDEPPMTQPNAGEVQAPEPMAAAPATHLPAERPMVAAAPAALSGEHTTVLPVAGSPAARRQVGPNRQFGQLAAIVLAGIAVAVLATAALLALGQSGDDSDLTATAALLPDPAAQDGASGEAEATPSSVAPLLGAGDTTTTTDGSMATTAPPVEQLTVPNLEGLNVERAGQILDEYGFTVVVTGQEAVGAVPGTVIRQVPEAGAMVTLPLAVTLYIPRTSSLPAMVGRPATAVCSELVALGLQCREEAIYSQEVAVGLVVSSAPAEGAAFVANQTVALQVSQGPVPTVAIPGLTGMSEAAATQRLEELEFAMIAIEYVESPTVPEGQAIATNPGEGVSHPLDQPVTIQVSSGPPATTTSSPSSTTPSSTETTEPASPSSSDTTDTTDASTTTTS